MFRMTNAECGMRNGEKQEMSVFFDHPRAQSFKGRSIAMAHLCADSEDELHAFARGIGLKPIWFQQRSHPHYDIFGCMIEAAKEAGAEELPRDEFVKRMRARRHYATE